LVYYIERSAQAECVREWGAEEDIWALEGRRNRRLEKKSMLRTCINLLHTKYQ